MPVHLARRHQGLQRQQHHLVRRRLLLASGAQQQRLLRTILERADERADQLEYGLLDEVTPSSSIVPASGSQPALSSIHHRSTRRLCDPMEKPWFLPEEEEEKWRLGRS
jgi:hypothetical protein